MDKKSSLAKAKKRYYRKRVELFELIDKIKLWPSRTGVLHGIRTIEKNGTIAIVTTHSNKKFEVNNSRNSRAARMLRNKIFNNTCLTCRIPDWRLDKFDSTRFTRKSGSFLNQPQV